MNVLTRNQIAMLYSSISSCVYKSFTISHKYQGGMTGLLFTAHY